MGCHADGPLEDPEKVEAVDTGGCREHVERLCRLLDDNGLAARFPAKEIVRGLDYYTRTVFAVKCDSLGSQNEIAGGGRYDALVKSMGGPDTPAVGWGLGFERSLMALQAGAAPPPAAALKAFLVAAAAPAQTPAFRLLERLRAQGVAADIASLGKSLKAQMREADQSGAAYAVILGEAELETGKYQLKNLNSGMSEAKQRPLAPEEIIAELKKC